MLTNGPARRVGDRLQYKHHDLEAYRIKAPTPEKGLTLDAMTRLAGTKAATSRRLRGRPRG